MYGELLTNMTVKSIWYHSEIKCQAMISNRAYLELQYNT